MMAFNTQATQDHNNNNYELCVDSNDTSNKGEFKKSSIAIYNYKEEDRWDTLMNATNGKGGDSETITNPNRIEC
jgi:hypothetical protein